MRRRIDLSERKVIFGWIDMEGDFQFVESLDDAIQEMRTIRSKLASEEERVTDAWNRGIVDPGSYFDCNGAFVIICNRAKETVFPSGYFTSMYWYLVAFNEENKDNDAICIPLHMNFNRMEFEFEGSKSVVRELFADNCISVMQLARLEDFNQIRKTEIKGFSFDSLTKDEKIIGEDISELQNVLDEIAGTRTLTVYANLAYPESDYCIPIFNAVFSFEDVPKVKLVMDSTIKALKDYMGEGSATGSTLDSIVKEAGSTSILDSVVSEASSKDTLEEQQTDNQNVFKKSYNTPNNGVITSVDVTFADNLLSVYANFANGSQECFTNRPGEDMIDISTELILDCKNDCGNHVDIWFDFSSQEDTAQFSLPSRDDDFYMEHYYLMIDISNDGKMVYNWRKYSDRACETRETIRFINSYGKLDWQ